MCIIEHTHFGILATWVSQQALPFLCSRALFHLHLVSALTCSTRRESVRQSASQSGTPRVSPALRESVRHSASQSGTPRVSPALCESVRHSASQSSTPRVSPQACNTEIAHTPRMYIQSITENNRQRHILWQTLWLTQRRYFSNPAQCTVPLD
jgi:hypothetical protein